MSENDSLETVRKKMLDLLEAGKTTSKWSKERPVDWNPGSVIDPNSKIGLSFTHRTCWGFIEQLLLDGHTIKPTPLKKPQGGEGYVMLFKTESGPSDIYIKLEIANGQLIGRSFHYSDWSK